MTALRSMPVELLLEGRLAVCLGACAEVAYKVDRLVGAGAFVRVVDDRAIAASILAHEARGAVIVLRRAPAIEDAEGWIEDDFLGLPSGPMYRTAASVLNPGDRSEWRRDTQLDALERTLVERGGVDVLMLWLGANDALGTVLNLELRDMADVPAADLPQDPVELLRWNLTSEARFKADFARICEQLSAMLRAHSPETQVFVGNIPYVTIPPLARGVGAFDGKYFERYQRFFVKSDGPASLLEALTRQEVIAIEQRIDTFNDAIKSNVAERERFHLVDVCGVLNRLAVRRNRLEAKPDQPLRDFLPHDHPLLQLDPVPSVLMYELDGQGRRVQGGLFSLDGIHPSTIGYGLIAELFLTEMQKVGVPGASPARLPWPAVIANDSLLQAPPVLWHHLLREGEAHATFWGLLARALA